MKRILVFLLACTFILCGCSSAGEDSAKDDPSASEHKASDMLQENGGKEESESVVPYKPVVDPTGYIEDTVYSQLTAKLDSDAYFIDTVEAKFISKEYIDELEYNSLENTYFGKKLSELDKEYQNKRYIFTTDEQGKTVVKEFKETDNSYKTAAGGIFSSVTEAYSDPRYQRAINDTIIGSGIVILNVILFSSGASDSISIMLASTTGESFCVLASGITSGIIKGIETNDLKTGLETALIAGSSEYKWCAVTGIAKGVTKIASNTIGQKIKSLPLGISVSAAIQQATQLPINYIKSFKTKEQYERFRTLGLSPETVNERTALIGNILSLLKPSDNDDISSVIQRLQAGKSLIDQATGEEYHLYQLKEDADSAFSLLKPSELKNKGLDDILVEVTEAHPEFWRGLAQLLE